MPRHNRTIQPLVSLPGELTPEIFISILNQKIEEINNSFTSLDMMESELRGEEGNTITAGSNVELGGKRVTGAGMSQSDSDYVTRGELRRNGLYVDHTGMLRTSRTIQTMKNVMSVPAKDAQEAVTLGQLESMLARLAPVGAILLWPGSIASIPPGWVLCDGTNGTPDLRNRFIPGAGGTYAVGATGGADSLNLAHTHADGTLATDAESAHTHTADGTLATGTPSATTTVDNDLVLSTVAVASSTHTHDVTGNTSAGSAHSHDVTGSTATALSATTENRPQYYALAYIMRI